jgi:cytochrome bd-type quinol oxidase subunit 1
LKEVLAIVQLLDRIRIIVHTIMVALTVGLIRTIIIRTGIITKRKMKNK